MKEHTVLSSNGLYKHYYHENDMWRVVTALRACSSRWVQQVLHIDEVLQRVHLSFYRQARDLSLFNEDDVLLFADIMPDIIRAIAYCHSNGWVHGDIKPSNILYLPEDNSIRLIDFGASYRIGTDRKRLRYWQATPGFSIVNQCIGYGVVSPADDWFSLTVVITQVQKKSQNKLASARLARVLSWLQGYSVNII